MRQDRPTEAEELEAIQRDRDPWGDIKVYARLTPFQAAELVRWARDEVNRRPALHGRFFRPDHRPKMGSILRWAALDRIKQKED